MDTTCPWLFRFDVVTELVVPWLAEKLGPHPGRFESADSLLKSWEGSLRDLVDVLAD